METKHTPGPWTATQDPNGSWRDYCIGTDAGIDSIAVCSQRDAALISAAPELLEAAMQAECKCTLAERDCGHRVDCWMPGLKSAIAKAVGHDG